MRRGTTGRKSGAEPSLTIELLGGFRLLRGDQATGTSAGAQRLLAFVALHPPSVRRVHVAGTLWPNALEGRAYACLRSALARLDTTSRAAIRATAMELAIHDSVRVDIHEVRALGRDLVGGASRVDPGAAAAGVARLTLDLLPGWYDDWVLAEAEDWRQLRLLALESIANRLLRAGHLSAAATAATAAARAEPLRESARAAVIRVHLSQGNQAEALQEFRSYEAALHRELGIRPTARLRDLIGDLLDPPAGGGREKPEDPADRRRAG